MWTRADLKARGKADFTRNYWVCVLISLILLCLAGGIKGIGSNNITQKLHSSRTNTYSSYDDSYGYDDGSIIDHFIVAPVVKLGHAILVGFEIFLGFVGILFTVFVAEPLIVGGRRFYLENQFEKGKLSRIDCIFRKKYYINTVLTMFLRNVFIMLWSLLLIIPGIVKSYSYWMIQYIMAENPTLSHERAFEISKTTMNGQRWNVFVLDLSFIPWYILSFLTCGLVGIFYVNSYRDATKAQLYGFLRMDALNQGCATLEELPGYSPMNPL